MFSYNPYNEGKLNLAESEELDSSLAIYFEPDGPCVRIGANSAGFLRPSRLWWY